MSLINDALKKAQKQRENTPGGTPPPPGAPPVAQSAAPSPAPHRQTAPSKTPIIIAGAAVIVALSVVATVFLLRPPGSRVASNENRAEPTPFRIAVSTAHLQEPARPTFPAAKPAPTAPIASNVAASIPIAAAPTPSPEVVIAPSPTPEPSPVKTTFRIQGLVDKFRISGIRLSDTDSKVILNDHLFRVGELIEPSLGLRLTKIEAHALAFVDADGNAYTKKF